MRSLPRNFHFIASALVCLQLASLPSATNANGVFGHSLEIFGNLAVTSCFGKCDHLKLNLGADKFYIGKNGRDVYAYSAANSGRIVKPGKWATTGNEITKIEVKGNVMAIHGKVKFAQARDFIVSFVLSDNSCKIKVKTKRGISVGDTSFDRSQFTCKISRGNIFAN